MSDEKSSHTDDPERLAHTDEDDVEGHVHRSGPERTLASGAERIMGEPERVARNEDDDDVEAHVFRSGPERVADPQHRMG